MPRPPLAFTCLLAMAAVLATAGPTWAADPAPTPAPVVRDKGPDASDGTGVTRRIRCPQPPPRRVLGRRSTPVSFTSALARVCLSNAERLSPPAASGRRVLFS